MVNHHLQTDNGDQHFRTTRWSVISQIRDPRSPASRTMLNTLLSDYWRPIYYYIQKKGIPVEQAKDLTQDFFYSMLYEKDLLSKARRSKGRFRSFLLTVLDRFLIDTNRYESAQKRSTYKEILDSDLIETIDIPDSYRLMSDQDSFNYAWTATMIENVSDQVREHFCSKGKELYWDVFDRRFKQPIINDTTPPSLSDLCVKCGIADEITASNMVTTVKRAFRKCLRTYIREYVYTDADVDEELSELLEFLRKKTQDAN